MAWPRPADTGCGRTWSLGSRSSEIKGWRAVRFCAPQEVRLLGPALRVFRSADRCVPWLPGAEVISPSGQGAT